MLQCREASELLASDAWTTASWRRRVTLRLHVLMCRYCRAYERGLRRMADMARRLHRSGSVAPRRQEAVLDAVRRAAAGPPAD